MTNLTYIKKIILGIDLGLSNLGYAILVTDGVIRNYISFNCFFTSKYICTSKRIVKIYNFLTEILYMYSPTLICLEKVFHTNNTNTFSTINQVHGVIILLLEQHNKIFFEITPKQVKIYNGLKSNCTKKEVIEQMKKRFKIIDKHKKNDDAFDALAIANASFYLFT